jgi:hypothetical protein
MAALPVQFGIPPQDDMDSRRSCLLPFRVEAVRCGYLPPRNACVLSLYNTSEKTVQKVLASIYVDHDLTCWKRSENPSGSVLKRKIVRCPAVTLFNPCSSAW